MGMRVGAFALAAGRPTVWGVAIGIAWLSAGLTLTSPAGAQGREPVADVAPGAELRVSGGRVPEARMLGGVVAPDEIVSVARHAGFVPRSRPVLRGAAYVMFATDHYLMDVRLTIDARSGRLLAATRLAGSAYGGPVYEGLDVLPQTLPRTYSPAYEPPPPAYDRTPAAPANVPLANVQPRAPSRNYGSKPSEAPEARAMPAGRATPGAAEQVRRATVAPPIPRRRPDEDAVESKASVPASPAPDTPPTLLGETATVPQQPAMVPITPPDGDIVTPPVPREPIMAPIAPPDGVSVTPAVPQQPTMVPITPRSKQI
jgi:hypothetical protein